MTQGERIRYLRKEILNMTLDKFGEKIGLKKSALSHIENGVNSLSDQAAKSICREFNVSEAWLRTGEGDPIIQLNLDDEIAQMIASLPDEPAASFKKKLLSVLANLTEEQWELLADMAEKLASTTNEEPER